MRSIRHLTTICAALLLTACAQPQITTDELAQLTPIDCTSKEQCDRMWQRAQIWLANHAPTRMQMANDTVITTFSAGGTNDATTSFSLTKSPSTGGAYQISSRAGCGNPFGCFPSPSKARAALHRYIRDTPP